MFGFYDHRSKVWHSSASLNIAVNNIGQEKLFEQVDAHEVIECEILFPDLHGQKMCLSEPGCY